MGKETSKGGHEAAAGAAPSASSGFGAIALVGFILVATAQASNQILAAGLPAPSRHSRWSIVAVGLAPIALAEIRDGGLLILGGVWASLRR